MIRSCDQSQRGVCCLEEQGFLQLSKRRTDSFVLQDEPRFAIDALPTIFVLIHDVFMREHVGFAFEALEMPERVILAGVSFDDLEAVVAAGRTDVFHAL